MVLTQDHPNCTDSSFAITFDKLEIDVSNAGIRAWWSSIRSPKLVNIAVISFDLSGHSEWARKCENQPSIYEARGKLRGLLAKSVAGFNVFEMGWAGDGGSYAAHIETPSDLEQVVEAVQILRGSFIRWKDESEIEIEARISATYIQTVIVGKDPGNWYHDELSDFLKYERDFGRPGYVVLLAVMCKHLEPGSKVMSSFKKRVRKFATKEVEVYESPGSGSKGKGSTELSIPDSVQPSTSPAAESVTRVASFTSRGDVRHTILVRGVDIDHIAGPPGLSLKFTCDAGVAREFEVQSKAVEPNVPPRDIELKKKPRDDDRELTAQFYLTEPISKGHRVSLRFVGRTTNCYAINNEERRWTNKFVHNKIGDDDYANIICMFPVNSLRLFVKFPDLAYMSVPFKVQVLDPDGKLDGEESERANRRLELWHQPSMVFFEIDSPKVGFEYRVIWVVPESKNLNLNPKFLDLSNPSTKKHARKWYADAFENKISLDRRIKESVKELRSSVASDLTVSVFGLNFGHRCIECLAATGPHSLDVGTELAIGEGAAGRAFKVGSCILTVFREGENDGVYRKLGPKAHVALMAVPFTKVLSNGTQVVVAVVCFGTFNPHSKLAAVGKGMLHKTEEKEALDMEVPIKQEIRAHVERICSQEFSSEGNR